MINNFFQEKKIFLTGHTGFKGSWLTMVLKELGAEVTGYSDMSTISGHYKLLKENNYFFHEIVGNINDYELLSSSISKKNYDYVIHFAAQGLVSKAHSFPENTLNSNIIGTFNMLKAANENESVNTIILATTDKVYKDHAAKNTEEFPLGGMEFYSASKAGAEMIIEAFKNTMKRNTLNVGTVRAGNVLGGGDHGNQRIVSDIINSLNNKKNILLRNPNSVRPWQYILDCLNGYLLTLIYCLENNVSEVFNFSPIKKNLYTVETLTKKIIDYWPLENEVQIFLDNNKKFYESSFLQIDSTKANNVLSWHEKFSFNEICKNIVDYETNHDKYNWSINHINNFFKK